MNLQQLESQVRARLQAFVNTCGVVPTDLFLGREEHVLIAGAESAAWIVKNDRVTYKGVLIHQVDSRSYIGVGLSA